MSQQNSAPPVWFWVVVVVAILWNLIGLLAFSADPFFQPESLDKMSQAQQDGYAARPTWVFIAFAVAVITGTIGSILLALKKTVASPVLLLSLIAVLLQNFYMFGIAGMHTAMDSASMALPMMIVLVAIFLVWFARFCAKKDWLS